MVEREPGGSRGAIRLWLLLLLERLGNRPFDLGALCLEAERFGIRIISIQHRLIQRGYLGGPRRSGGEK